MNRIIQVLTGVLGALAAVLICAVAGIDFSAQDEVIAAPQKNVLMGQSPTTLNYQISELSQLRSQNQQLQTQLFLCKTEASNLRLDALMNQPTQQRR